VTDSRDTHTRGTSLVTHSNLASRKRLITGKLQVQKETKAAIEIESISSSCVIFHIASKHTMVDSSSLRSSRSNSSSVRRSPPQEQQILANTSWEGTPQFTSAPPTSSDSPMQCKSNQNSASPKRWQQQQQQQHHTSVVSPRPQRISPSPQNNNKSQTYTRIAPVVSKPTKNYSISSFHRTSGGITVQGGSGGGGSVPNFFPPSSSSSSRNTSHTSLQTSSSASPNTSSLEESGSMSSLDAWRKFGKKFRANLILADDANGGNAFTLSETCSIERYYRVADRVRACVCVCVQKKKEKN
jgi:hypothetical protein